jgi:hypothetical protein
MQRTASKDMATIAAKDLTHALMHPAPAAPFFSAIGGVQLEALRQLATIFDAALPRYATGSSVPSTNTNNAPSKKFRSPPSSAPACTTTPAPAPRATVPTHAPPRMGPPSAPSPSVGPRLAPSPRVGPRRASAPSARLSQAPSPRVNPTPVPSPRVGPTRDPPVMQATPSQFRRHPPYPMAQASARRGPSQRSPAIPGTNLNGDFADEIEQEHPPRHRTHSQTARHSAHMFQSILMANAVIHPTTGANMEYRGLISDEETFPIWDRAATNEFGRLAQGVALRDPTQFTSFPDQLSQVTKLLHMVVLLLIYDQTRKRSIECACQSVGTS